MNSGSKGLNATKNTLTSFVAAPVEAVTNAAVNTANSIKNTTSNMATSVANSLKNTFNTNSLNDLTEPINESIEGVVENNTAGLLSIPIILTLGSIVVLFILFIVFRDQIVLGLEIAWQKVKELFGGSTPVAQPPPPTFSPDTMPVDQSSIEKLLPGRKQVFNIAQDKYTYTDAEPLCKAFGAELATYDQVKEAWNKGADWCNYGWIKGQAAVYPTQQDTYDKLQAGPEDQQMACGIPGVNGGYFDNPELRFGVNCYGVKPNENESDVRKIMANSGDLTPDAIQYDRKVQDYKVHLNQIPVNPFKSGTWSS
jgi:Extracellular link domain